MGYRPSRKQSNQEEIEYGRKTVRIELAMSVINQLNAQYEEYGLKVELDSTFNDPRKWEVIIKGKRQGLEARESFWDYPSDELVTKLMLLGVI